MPERGCGEGHCDRGKGARGRRLTSWMDVSRAEEVEAHSTAPPPLRTGSLHRLPRLRPSQPQRGQGG